MIDQNREHFIGSLAGQCRPCSSAVHGDRNLAAALRRNARDATRVPPLLGITSP
jgi:hypothetical protein